MYNNYDYPCEADTPDAPWNQTDQEPVEVCVTVSQTLSRSTAIEVTDYQANEWEDWETGDEGEVIHTGGIDYDFSDSDLQGAFEAQEYTIPQLLDYLKDYLIQDIAECPEDGGRKRKLESILECCEGWEVDETEVVED